MRGGGKYLIYNNLENIIPIKSNDLYDYKFFCFNGEPKFLKVDFGRFSEHRANYYDLNWNLLPFGEEAFPPDYEKALRCPVNFKKMIDLARILSEGQKFLRVDFYNVCGKIYFGELTFFPNSGVGKFTPEEADLEIGKLLKLQNENLIYT